MTPKTVEIGGKRWPVCFSLYCLDAVPDIMGLMQRSGEAAKMTGSDLRTMLEFVHSLIVSGCEFCNTWHAKPDGVEFDENGKIQPLSKKAFLLATQDMDDLSAILEVVQEVVAKDGRKTINAVPVSTGTKKKKRRH